MSNGLQMKYFVLKPGGKGAYAEASRVGMKAYAEEIRHENPVLAREISDWVEREEKEAIK